jgi:hypothetical protein
MTAIKVSFNNVLAGNYSAAHVMQLLRSAKARAEKKQVKFDGLDNLFIEISKQLKINNRCPCCDREYKITEGKPGNSSLSVHRVVSSLGYVVGNVKAICNGCNKDIGECNSLADVERKEKNLRWQAITMIDIRREIA